MRACLAIVASLAGLLAGTGEVLGQAAWEYSPYAVRVWAAIDDPAALPAPAQAALWEQLAALADAQIGAPWSLKAELAPEKLRGAMLADIGALSPQAVLAADEQIERKADKAMLIALARQEGQWRIAVRELDVPTQQLSPTLVRSAADDGALGHAMLQAVVDAFSPLAALRRAEDDRVQGRLRASGLAVEKDSPVLVAPGAPLVCVLRPEDRLGRAREGQVRVVPWTLLEVLDRDGAKVQCQIHSAQARPLAGRASVRVKRYALAVRPAARPTQLTLQTPGQSPLPLAGYEIIEQAAGGRAVALLGRTDQEGRIDISPSAAPFRLLYVRHGDRVLARLPIIPGWQEQVAAPIHSDDARLAAAAFIATLRQEIVDTVARRQILAARLARRIDAGQLDEAQKLLAEFQRLPGQRDFAGRLQSAKSRFTAPNTQGQEQIEKLFAEAHDALRRYLDPQELDRLELKLAQAKGQ